MNKTIKLLIVIAMLCAMLVGCATAGSADDWTRMEEKIKEDAAKFFSTEQTTYKANQVRLTLVSQVGDAYVMFVDIDWGYMAVITTVQINGLEFVYPSSQEMYAYKDGEFMNLKPAFEAGWLSAEQLQTVWEDYQVFQKRPPEPANTNPQPSTPPVSVPEPVPTDPPGALRRVYLPIIIQEDLSQTAIEYDADGNITGFTSSYDTTVHAQWTVEVDALNRRVTLRNAEAQRTEVSVFDEAGRELSWNAYLGNILERTVENTYDDQGRLVKMLDTHWGEQDDPIVRDYYYEVIYTYNDQGKLETESWYSYAAINGQQTPKNLNYSYCYSYDETGKLVRMEFLQDGEDLENYTTYTYNAKERTVTANTYDIRDRLQGTKVTYYDEDGRVIKIEDKVDQNETVTIYQYQKVYVKEDAFVPKIFQIPEEADWL